MSLDEDKFDAAMTDHFAEVVGMFSANTNNQSSYGSAARGLAGDAVKSISDIISARGALLSNSETAQGRIDSYQLDLETLNTRMEALLARYTKQFALMESFVGQTNSMRESLTATFDGMMAMYTNK
jgi:flagellar capping protein FliD